MKIKEASMVTTAVMFLIAIATFFVGKVSSQRADHRHRNDKEKHVEETSEKYRQRSELERVHHEQEVKGLQRNELERVHHEQELKDLHKYYQDEEDRLRDNWNLPAKNH